MWKTAIGSATLAAILTAGIGAGVILATSDGGPAASPHPKPAAAVDTRSIPYDGNEPPVIRAASMTGEAARPRVESDAQGHGQPAMFSDPADADDETPAPSPDMTGREDMWRHMEQMHGPEHVAAMHEHMDAVHGEGAFESVPDHMGGGMMGGGMTGGSFDGMMGGGGMMDW